MSSKCAVYIGNRFFFPWTPLSVVLSVKTPHLQHAATLKQGSSHSNSVGFPRLTDYRRLITCLWEIIFHGETASELDAVRRDPNKTVFVVIVVSVACPYI